MIRGPASRWVSTRSMRSETSRRKGVVLALHHLAHQAGDEPVAVVRDDGLGRGVQGLGDVVRGLGRHAVQLLGEGRIQGHAFAPDLGVAFKVFQGGPAGGQEFGQKAFLVDAPFHFLKHRVEVRAVGDAQGTPFSLPFMGELQGGSHGRVRAHAAPGHGFHRRAAQKLREPGRVDGFSLALDLVHHVQDQHHGDAELQKLDREVEVAFQGSGVEHR